MTTVLELRGLTKSFGGLNVTRAVDLAARDDDPGR